MMVGLICAKVCGVEISFSYLAFGSLNLKLEELLIDLMSRQSEHPQVSYKAGLKLFY